MYSILLDIHVHTQEEQWLTANKTGIVKHVLFLILLGSEVGEGVDDHAKDQVLNDDDDDKEEEGEIIHDTQNEQRLLIRDKDGENGKVF